MRFSSHLSTSLSKDAALDQGMEDRLSPLSYDSGLHSISAPSSPKKLFEGTTTARPEDEPPPKRPKKEGDARVPASTESSEETLSSDDAPLPTKEQQQCQSFCSSKPSTSREEPLITAAVEKSRRSLSPRLSQAERYVDEIEEQEEKPEEEEEDSQKTRTKERRSYIGEKPTCAWDECSQAFNDVNFLFDHVMETHIKDVVNRTEGHDDELECLWAECEMSIVRGDWTKKTRWLKEHYKTRHAKGAQAVKCVIEQCTFRCTTYGKLDDHVRKMHLETKEGETKGSKKLTEKVKTRKEDDGDTRPPYFPLLQNEFPWNEYYVQILVERQQKRREMNGQCEWMLKRRPGKGAARRKAHAPLVGEFVSKLKPPPPSTSTPDPGIRASFKMTLEDLFPGWGYKSPFSKTEESKKSPLPASEPFSPVESVPKTPPSTPPKSKLYSPALTPFDFLLPQLPSFSSSSKVTSSTSSSSHPPADIEIECSNCLEYLITSVCC